jgi:hypothetical protein
MAGTDALTLAQATRISGSPTPACEVAAYLRAKRKLVDVGEVPGRGYMRGNPTTGIDRAKARQPYRTTFTGDERRAIIAGQAELRDPHRAQTAARLPDPAFWHDLERHIIDIGAGPAHYLLCKRKVIPRQATGREPIVRYWPEQPMSTTPLHLWWYRCLEHAGIVAEGTTAGERMHKARHTAGQRVLDKTGDLKLVQKLLGHESIKTTGDVYLDYDIDQWAERLARVLDDEEGE